MERKDLVVLNPVIEGLLGDNYQELITELEGSGAYVGDSKKGISVVRELYGKRVDSTSTLVIDSRCPSVVDIVRREFEDLTCHLVSINPILITGALIAYEECRAKHKDEEIDLIVVTPCNALANYDLEQLPSGTRLITWSNFVRERKLHYSTEVLDESPVPLGFFGSLEVEVVGASGEKEVRRTLGDFGNIALDCGILELLYCNGGCHRGDGL